MDLAPLIAGSGAAYLIASLIMAFLYRQERATYMAWWAAAFGASAIRQAYALSVQLFEPHPYMLAPIFLAVILSGVFLLRGSYLFIEREFPRAWYVVALVTGVWTAVAPFVSDSFLAFCLPAFLLRGFCDIFTGVMIFLTRRRGMSRAFTGIAFVVWGIHRWNYPFLRNIEWFASWGFELSSVLGTWVAMGILALHYEQNRANLVRREEEYRGLFENAAIGLIRTDLNGRILDANPALVRLLGYDSVDDLRKLTMADDVYATPADRQRLLDNYREQDVLDGVEVNWRRRDGAIRAVKLMTRRFETDDGTMFEGSVRDVTTEKKLQSQLSASRQMEALGRLAGGVAHDFNNMLTAIVAGSQMARLDAEDGNIPVEELDRIEQAASQASALARRLLAFSRRDVEEPQPLQVDESVQNATALLERLIPRTVTLDVVTGAANRTVSTQPGQLERMIVNLAVNANEAMNGHGTIAIRTHIEDDAIVVEVRDDGEGMDDKTVSRIFEPYFTTNNDSGTGLGLANVQEIVRELGGTIEVESEPGDGSMFRIYLPMTREESGEVEVLSVDDVEGGGRLILLAEDTDLVRVQLVRFLEHSGFEVLPAADGASAFEIARQRLHEIDLVVTDVVMPGKTGPELIAELLELRPELQFIYMSGYAESALTDKGVPTEQFMAKPFRPSELTAKIESLLRARVVAE